MKNLLENVHNPYLMEVLYKFVDSDLTHMWLLESKLIPNLVAMLQTEESEEVSIILTIVSICKISYQSLFY